MTGHLVAVFLLLGTVRAQVRTDLPNVMRAVSTSQSDPSQWTTALVSVTELGMPSNATKEFEKASRFIAKRDWARAADRLEKGLAIYPRSAVGYNNLGATYAHLGNTAQARVALEQAVVLDARLAPAYVNLGRLSFLEKDYVGAEYLLNKANSLGPAPDADELFLLAYVQLSNHHLDQAIQTSHQGHEGRFSHHGSLHLVAASAYEKEGKISESISELEVLLSEEPSGPQSDHVRKMLERFEARAAAR